MCTLHFYKLPTKIGVVYIHVTHRMSPSGTNIYTVHYKHACTHTHISHIQSVYPCILYPSLSSEWKSLSLSLFLPSSSSATAPPSPVPQERPGLHFLQLHGVLREGRLSTHCFLCFFSSRRLLLGLQELNEKRPVN